MLSTWLSLGHHQHPENQAVGTVTVSPVSCGSGFVVGVAEWKSPCVNAKSTNKMAMLAKCNNLKEAQYRSIWIIICIYIYVYDYIYIHTIYIYIHVHTVYIFWVPQLSFIHRSAAAPWPSSSQGVVGDGTSVGTGISVGDSTRPGTG